jgi:hypothetical protein
MAVTETILREIGDNGKLRKKNARACHCRRRLSMISCGNFLRAVRRDREMGIGRIV